MNISTLSPELNQLLEQECEVMEIPAGTEILREGQYVKIIPIVLEGLIKVFSRHEEKELLLYYIQPAESCVMSFAAGMQDSQSTVFAVTEEDSKVLVMPVPRVLEWRQRYPELNSLFFDLYNQRYSDLMDTINLVLFERMDTRVYEYLTERVRLTGKNPIRISHRQIAQELGSAREVVSRVLKKLEHEGKVSQQGSSIEILSV